MVIEDTSARHPPATTWNPNPRSVPRAVWAPSFGTVLLSRAPRRVPQRRKPLQQGRACRQCSAHGAWLLRVVWAFFTSGNLDLQWVTAGALQRLLEGPPGFCEGSGFKFRDPGFCGERVGSLGFRALGLRSYKDLRIRFWA